MSLGLDDKLLGEKTHYYCSSSEDEGEEEVSQVSTLMSFHAIFAHGYMLLGNSNFCENPA